MQFNTHDVGGQRFITVSLNLPLSEELQDAADFAQHSKFHMTDGDLTLPVVFIGNQVVARGRKAEQSAMQKRRQN